jgi:hypothetical protein
MILRTESHTAQYFFGDLEVDIKGNITLRQVLTEIQWK